MRGPQTPADAEQAESTRLRLTFLTLLVATLFMLLFGRLWYLQVMAGDRYVELSQSNASRTLSLEAARGKILDRDGDVLVGNRYANVVSVQPGELGEQADTVLADLADLLGTTSEEIEARIAGSTVDAVRPKPVAIDVPTDIVFYIWENQSTRYPGVYAESLPLRSYPHGPLAAHVVGYLGQISPDELAQERYADYRPGADIGRTGVERTYEQHLQGVEGLRVLEVNARGDVLRQVSETRPQPGSDLVLTLDIDIQRFTETALAEGIAVASELRDTQGRGDGTFAAPAGAALVMDVDTGAVRAMASYPAFDPGEFVGGVSADYYAGLLAEENHFPLLNRTIQSSYPPGSVFKVVPASAALRHGLMTATSELPCPGTWRWGSSSYNNWTRSNSGSMTLAESLTHSCDTVYYELARRMWEREQDTGVATEFLTEEARAWGFGKKQGIDLPSERAGVVPGRRWREQYWRQARHGYCRRAESAADASAKQLFTELCSEQGATWRGGDAVNMAIGQGDMQATPLQVANAFAAIANGGTLWRPHVGHQIVHRDGRVVDIRPEKIGELPLGGAELGILRSGLEGVTADGGTAGSVFSDFPVPVAGKTGTAEQRGAQPYAWFAAYAPADEPRYVVVAMVEEGGGGSQTAAPIVRRILEGLFDLELQEIDPGRVTD